MRLIDVDELLEEIKSMRICLGNKDIFPPDARESVLELIENVPTAYDIDKVVKELEEEREEILNSDDYENEIINYCLDNFDMAIEIIKKNLRG